MNFIIKEISAHDVASQCFFTTHASVIRKIAHGESLFESNDGAVHTFSNWTKESWLPLPSSIQLVELKVNDSDFCETTGKDE